MNVELTDDERAMLLYGVNDWGGPAWCTESMALAMGFDGLDGLESASQRMADAIETGVAMSIRDWTRALISTEAIFASEVVGTGGEWTVIQGGTTDDIEVRTTGTLGLS